jgi:hypothetical protein
MFCEVHENALNCHKCELAQFMMVRKYLSLKSFKTLSICAVILKNVQYILGHASLMDGDVEN